MSNNLIQTTGLNIPVNPYFDPYHDTYWNQVASLLHFDGAQNSTSFSDVKGNAITSSGGVVVDRGSPVISPTSIYFPGTSSQQFSMSESDNVGTGDFTIEFFVSWETISNSTLFDTRPVSTNGPYIDFFYSNGYVGVWMNNATLGAGLISVTLGQPYHIVLQRKAGLMTCYVNGIQLWAATYSTAISIPRFYLGGNGYNTSIEKFKGRMSEFRYTKGVARYANNFTPVFQRFPQSL